MRNTYTPSRLSLARRLSSRRIPPSDACGASDGIYYHINASHKHLVARVGDIAGNRIAPSHIFCHNRNLVQLIEIDGHRYVIKRYKRPTRANQLVYTFLRMNKARRSYVYARRLEILGIHTPAPVACLERRKHGITHTVWYVSEYMPFPTFREAYRRAAEPERRRMVDAIVDFTASMHRKGVCQRDSNSSNVLVDKTDNGFRFYMVDINRMDFGLPPGIYKSILAFMQCELDFSRKLSLVRVYARIRHFPVKLCELAAHHYRFRQAARRVIRI